MLQQLSCFLEHLAHFSQCEKHPSDTPVPLFGQCQNFSKRQKLHKVEECIFGRILPVSASYCLSALMISHIQYWSPPPSLHFSAWNRHSYGNGFLCYSVSCRNATATVSLSYVKTNEHAKYNQYICNLFFMQQPFNGNDSPSFLTTFNRYKVRFFNIGFKLLT